MRRWSLLLTLITLLTACERIPLLERETRFYLKLKIHLKTNIELPTTKAEETLPEMMQVNFYDVETHELVNKVYVSAEGGYVDIESGVYDVVIYNLGTQTTRIDKTGSRGGIYAFTEAMDNHFLPQQLQGNGGSLGNQLIINEPDHLYVARMEQIVVPERSVEDETVELYAEAETILETYLFRATQIAQIEHATSVKGFVSGQAQAKHLWDGRFTTDQATIGFDCMVDKTKGELRAYFNTFGKLPNVQNKVYLHLFVGNASGDAYEYVFDVTDQFDNPDNKGVIEVTDKIVVPEPGTDQGGFAPIIDDWEEESKDIEI